MTERRRKGKSRTKDGAGLWYKDAIIYEVHVRSFFDSDDDGIGDFKGLTEKLDYLQDLGVTALWLLPFCPSPLRDDGYDISEYTGINPDYGSMRDFRAFLKAAHQRGFKVITELVLNHTSDQHPWFQRARRAKPESKWRNFYVWSDDPNRYQEARVIFKDFEASNWAWDPVAQSYYWHRFFSHQPDLNFENPAVQKAMFQVVDFWFGLGVDGLRLDAIPYLYEEEGTDCVGLAKTHDYLKMLRKHVDEKFKDRMFLAEVNMWPEEAISFFGSGDECHMSFHFPLMPRLFMAVKMEDRYPIVDILKQTPEIPSICQWAGFLRNHDELTLEMVTDEERDYMYRSYVQDPQAKINAGIRRRLAPLLGNNRRKIELMNGLLFSLLGTPIIYYGDEIGMGDNIYLGDRNGVRTPMQWSADRNAGFSRANPQKLVSPVTIDPEYHFEAINVQAQENNPHSLLWWMRRLISLRKRYQAFSRGVLEFLPSENHKILAFLRRWRNQQILVLVNLSRFTQVSKIDLSSFSGMYPLELFGQNPFPPIGKDPYFFMLSPHSFCWFSLEKSEEERVSPVSREPKTSLPILEVKEKWENFLSPENKKKLTEFFPEYLQIQPWFAGKKLRIRQVEIVDAISLFKKGYPAYLLLLQVNYIDHEFQAYMVGLTLGAMEKIREVRRRFPEHILAKVRFPEEHWEGGLYNAVSDPDFCEVLLDFIGRRRRFKASQGEIVGTPTAAFKKIKAKVKKPLTPKVLEGEQTNTSVIFGESFILKIFRQLEWGTNPELEITRFLSQKNFPHVPPFSGAVEFHSGKEEPVTLAVLYGFISNQGEAWDYTLDSLGRFFETALALSLSSQAIPIPLGSLLECSRLPVTSLARDLIGPYLISAEQIGEVTAQLHRALASDPHSPTFRSEPFDPHYQRSLYQSMRNLANQTFMDLRKKLAKLPEDCAELAEKVLGMERKIQEKFKAVVGKKIEATRIRCHGDYHLRQLLYTGKDFVIIDFEGEPTRHWSERKLKRSPFRDLASMIRSFHYATHASLQNEALKDLASGDHGVLIKHWAQFWYRWVSGAFLRGYFSLKGLENLLPKEREHREILLKIHLLGKCVFEIDFELLNRPSWVKIPLQGILQLMEEPDKI